MKFSPRAAELTTLLESRMTNFYTNFQVDEIGRVVSVGDGIARRTLFSGSWAEGKEASFQKDEGTEVTNSPSHLGRKTSNWFTISNTYTFLP
jgi:hypothetical protein